MLNVTAQGLPVVLENAITPFTEPTTAKLFAKQAQDPPCGQLASTAGTPGLQQFIQLQ